MASGDRAKRAETAERSLRASAPDVRRLWIAALAFLGGIVGGFLGGEGGAGIAFLVALAALGVFALLLGLLRLLRGGDRRADDLSRTLFTATSDAAIIVQNGEEIAEANAAYLRLSLSREGQAPLPDRFLGRIPNGQAPLGVLMQAIAEGNHAVQSFPFDTDADGRRLIVAVHPLDGGRRVLWLLSLSENQALRPARAPTERRPAPRPAAGLVEADALSDLAALWEVAPVGLMLISTEEARLPNGMLAHWLGYHLADWGTGGVPLAEVVTDESRSTLMTALANEAVAAAGIDVDFIRSDGSLWPARAFIGGHAAGASVLVALPRSRAVGVGEAVEAANGSAAKPGWADAALFFRSPLAMASVDRAGRIGEANGSFSRLFAAGGASVVGNTLERLVVERDAPAVERLLKDAATGQSLPPVEAAIAGEGGRSARIYAAVLEGAGLAVYAVDTTAQRSLEAQFAQSQKMQAIGQLAGGVAHDFNNVLTAIIGYCDLLLANHRPSDPSFPDIMQIKQNANRAAGLVRQLLAFSRRQTLRPQVIHLTDVLSDLSMLLRRLIGESIDLKVEHGRDLWPVKVDVNQFEQVIVNLAVNARDAMPGGGQLTLRTLNMPAGECHLYGSPGTLAPADYVLVEVTDTGTGIPPDIIDKIFEPFFSTKDVGKGTGLGLSTVYGIVQQTGGHILADSTLGKGSVFRVFLPRHVAGVEDAAPAPAPEAEQRPAPDLTGQGTILLVEDEDAVRAFATRALVARGYHVISAASGAEALEEIDKAGTRIDLVISDVVMPEMDGPTLLKALRARDPSQKVIFISGYAQEAFGKNLAEGEKFSFLPKPFSLKQLVAAVKDATAGG
ncbi:MAG: hypothetical protein B7X99_02775 [Rhizobiales bacterium 17-65-6]|nr:MAG: hypothetical protein B7Z30_13315 [Rhizobiales bacterium 12-68-15]OYX87328.1 MAG: hypothetical protein B7Y84_12005 [Azorhizobium sp. 32-67-21]OZA00839.1 MAG: hypothetical protein B7X99_02775 [Rhizobiales bacterium 17-65-6]